MVVAGMVQIMLACFLMGFGLGILSEQGCEKRRKR